MRLAGNTSITRSRGTPRRKYCFTIRPFGFPAFRRRNALHSAPVPLLYHERRAFGLQHAHTCVVRRLAMCVLCGDRCERHARVRSTSLRAYAAPTALHLVNRHGGRPARGALLRRVRRCQAAIVAVVTSHGQQDRRLISSILVRLLARSVDRC